MISIPIFGPHCPPRSSEERTCLDSLDSYLRTQHLRHTRYFSANDEHFKITYSTWFYADPRNYAIDSFAQLHHCVYHKYATKATDIPLVCSTMRISHSDLNGHYQRAIKKAPGTMIMPADICEQMTCELSQFTTSELMEVAHCITRDSLFYRLPCLRGWLRRDRTKQYVHTHFLHQEY